MPDFTLVAMAVVVVLLIAVVALVIIRRRRKSATEEASVPPDIGQPIDYTSLPVEEPKNLADRIREAPPAVKILALLLPLIVVVGGLALYLLFFSAPPEVAVPPTPTPIPPAIAITSAEVAGLGKIVIRGSTTNLGANSAVSAALTEDGQPFDWFDPDTALADINALNGDLILTLDRRDGAPTPRDGAQYAVTLVAVLSANGTIVRSDSFPVTILPQFAADFYQQTVLEPTPEPAAPTPEPAAPTPEPAAPTPEPAPVPTPDVPLLTGTVSNGGNIRERPDRNAPVVGQAAQGQLVRLLERSVDGEWYRIESDNGAGWMSRTLLTVEPDVAAQVPLQVIEPGLTTTVFNGGNVRAEPSINGQVLDQINAGETVQLLARTSNGNWYKIVNPRQIIGWVSRTLLNVPQEARNLPVSSAPVPIPPAATLQALPQAPTPVPTLAVPPSPSGATAVVFNGGNVRSEPNLNGRVLDQINAGETVQLLARTADGNWYQIINIRGVTGWVNRTLLTIDPEVARRVPQAP